MPPSPVHRCLCVQIDVTLVGHPPFPLQWVLGLHWWDSGQPPAWCPQDWIHTRSRRADAAASGASWGLPSLQVLARRSSGIRVVGAVSSYRAHAAVYVDVVRVVHTWWALPRRVWGMWPQGMNV